MEDLTGLGKVLDSEVAKRAYEDAVAPSAQQAGGIASDVLKTLHLFLAPIQLAAVAQDRFRRWLDDVRSKVPADRQVEAAPEIAGPVLMNLRFLADDNALRHLYLRLLELAIDKDRQEAAHPAYIRVIEHLSPRDAHFLFLFAKISPLFFRSQAGPIDTEDMHVILVSSAIKKYHPFNSHDIKTSLELLRGLSVVHFDSRLMELRFDYPQEIKTEVHLTEFGKTFVNACFPADWKPD